MHKCLTQAPFNFAFTLAETLITLGIIGIVAALTIPALTVKYQKKTTVTRLKKCYTEFAQAVQMAEAENGTVDTWNINLDADDEENGMALTKPILKYLKIVKSCDDGHRQECFGDLKNINGEDWRPLPYSSHILADGSSFLITGGGTSSSSKYSPHLHIYVDIDGRKKGTTTLGKDVFPLFIGFGKQKPDGANENQWKQSGFNLFGAGWIPGLNREDLFNDDEGGCSKSAGNAAGRYCGALIQYDGWEIKDDYPW